MPLGGELRFHLGQERRDTAAAGSGPGPGHWIVLSVTDTGNGMPPEVLERVFDPFFTTKAPGRGTGLGLSQAYGIVTEHRGHITVDSRPAQGTTFTIYLPSLAERGPIAAVEAGLDLAPVRQALAHLLDALDYQALTASSAENALEIHAAHAGTIALVLTDLVMPGMGGLGLVRELRRQGVQVPVVMMSGYVGDSARATVEGVLTWVEKPVTARRLGAILQEAIGLSSAVGWGRWPVTASPPSGPPRWWSWACCWPSGACCSRWPPSRWTCRGAASPARPCSSAPWPPSSSRSPASWPARRSSSSAR
jgi:CheY-like chemotaxis protein